MKNRIRYTIEKVLGNSFYQMPKFLFGGEFQNLSNDARVLYMLLKNRHELSVKNKWYNDVGEVYLIMSREEMETTLNLSAPTIRKILKELKDVYLIDEERQGLNRPNILYLLECKILSVRSEKNLQSREKEFFNQEDKSFSPINTNQNQTDFSNTDSIYLSATLVDNSDNDRLIDSINIENKFVESKNANPTYNKSNLNNTLNKSLNKEKYGTSEIVPPASTRGKISQTLDNLNSHYLINRYPDKANRIQEIYNIVSDVLHSNKKEYKFSNEFISDNNIKHNFFQLTSDHIEYLLDSLDNTKSDIKNMKYYLIKSLYNAPLTISNHDKQKYNSFDVDEFFRHAAARSLVNN